MTMVDEFPDEISAPKDSLQGWREQILNWVLYGTAFFGAFVVIGGLENRLEEGRTRYAVFYLFGYGAILLAAFVRRLGFLPRALILLGVMYALAVSGFKLHEIGSAGPVFLFATVAMATVLFGLSWGVGALLLCGITIVSVAAGYALGCLETPSGVLVTSPQRWFTHTAIFLGLGAMTVISTAFLINRLESSVETSADLVRSLKQRSRERERARQALRASEMRLLEAQRVAHIGSVEWEFRERNTWWSDELYRVLGREVGADPPRFEKLLEEIHPEDRVRVAAGVRGWLAGAGPSSLESRLVAKDGSIRHLRAQARLEMGVDGEPERLLGTVQDITEARELEEQFRQSQKLEALGQLAGGVAHDFNNLLSVISGYAGGLVADLQGEAQEAAKEVSMAAQRASALTRQLLAFSRRQFLQPRILDLNDVVQELEGMLRRVIGEDVECELLLASSLGRVRADAGQIQQVVLNLALNARDAMPEGGTLRIETYEVDSSPESTGTALDAEPIRHICLSVSDDGCGMDPETRARVFEPFFTTKNPGSGTGLGLSTVYGIVKQSDGQIRVRSAPGRGTTVKVYLPRFEGAEAPAEVGPSGLEVEQGRGETILLVEDEEPVRRMLRKMLERSGYRVLEAGEGTEALATVRITQGNLDLVLTDVVMPRMGGIELAERLREEWPKIRVLFMSGYAPRASSIGAAIPAGVVLLEKPLGWGEVTKVVRETLDA